MWLVRSEWKPLTDGVELGPIEELYPDQDKARAQGLKLTTLRGTSKVEVFDHEGTLAYSWEESDNLWREHLAATHG